MFSAIGHNSTISLGVFWVAYLCWVVFLGMLGCVERRVVSLVRIALC